MLRARARTLTQSVLNTAGAAAAAAKLSLFITRNGRPLWFTDLRESPLG